MSNTVLTQAKDFQLTNRVQKDAAGNYLCRRCNKVVPHDYKFVMYLPEDPSKVWGPYCCDECICYAKICSHCGKDYIIDHEGEITYEGDGIWICHECKATQKRCTSCDKLRPLIESPIGEVCKECFNKKLFACQSCTKTLPLNLEQKQDREKYSHVFPEEVRICTHCFQVKTLGVEPLKIKKCECCNKNYTYKRNLSYNYCPTCIKNKDVRKCDGCFEYHHRWDSYHRDKIFCAKCQPKLAQCENCESWDIKNRFSKRKGKVKDSFVCPDCYKQGQQECPKCFNFGTIRKDDGTCSICHSKLTYCSRCKQYHFGESYCRILMQRPQDYGYKPLPYFNYTDKENTSVFFGFENEVAYVDGTERDLALREIYMSYPSTQIYIKNDSSIEGPGFEVVSQPMTYEFFSKNFNAANLFERKFKPSNTSCGLHIHLSKKSFDGQVHLYKFIKFINLDENKKFIKKIAGRVFNSYAKQYTDKVSSCVKGSKPRERYHAVNLTPKHTVEIRIFKGAESELELRSRIEFTMALLEFTRNAPITNLTHGKFEKWFKSYGKCYKNLVSVLNA